MYLKCDLRTFDLNSLGSKFDVILVDPPLEEYQRRASGITFNWSPLDWEDVSVGGFERDVSVRGLRGMMSVGWRGMNLGGSAVCIHLTDFIFLTNHILLFAPVNITVR